MNYLQRIYHWLLVGLARAIHLIHLIHLSQHERQYIMRFSRNTRILKRDNAMSIERVLHSDGGFGLSRLVIIFRFR